MWTVFILLICCGLRFSVSTSPPSPLNVSFSSVNLRNVLHWLPGINSPDDTLFTVEYAIYGDSIQGTKGRRVNWRVVQKCKEIVRTWCDLSRETEDEEQGYHARVRAVTPGASSKWTLTWRRFDPKVDTSFGPPLVSVEVENNSAIITLRGPLRYPTKNHSSMLSLAAIYPQMTYILSINNTYRNQVHHVPVVASPHKHRLLDYNTQYCFSAQSRFLSLPIQCQPSAWHCVITPQDPLIVQLRTVVVGIVVPGLCVGMIAVAGYLLHQYLTGKGQKRPYILNSPYFHPVPKIFPPENHSHIIVSISKTEFLSDPVSTVSDPERSRGQQPIAGLPPVYSPQGPGALPEEVGDDLSIDYGFVSVAPKIIEEEDEERERRLDEGNAGTCAAGSNHPRSWLGVVGCHSPGDFDLLRRSSRMHNVSQTCREARVSVDAQTQINTCDHVSASSQMNSTLLAQTQVASPAFQRSTVQVSRKEEEEEEEEEEALPGLFSKENVDERHEPENIPLLSTSASQNIQNTSTSPPAHSDYLHDDYAILAGATQENEEDDYDYGDEEEGEKVYVGYDPETGKLVLPAFCQEERVDIFRVSEERKNSIGGEDEDKTYVMKGELRLENVFVRQASGEEELEQGGATGCEVDELLSKWDLQISMGE